MRNIALFLTALSLSSCAKEVYHHGYSFEQNNVQTIKVGEADYGKVLSELGSPTTKSNFGPKTLYYINYSVEKIAFLDPKITEQKVLAIAFNDKDVVSNIMEYTLDDSNQVAFSEGKTEIQGNTLTPIEQIMTNIGKFNKKTKQY
jgi:outer membrane protein assembly factor BamE (lipoprotein component of BamABCDE complex)